MRRLLRLLSLCSLIIAAAVAPAIADDEGVNAYVDPDGNPRVDVEDNVSIPGHDSDAGDGEPECIWRVAIADDFATGVYDADGTRLFSSTGRWLEQICDGNAVAVGGGGVVPEGEPVDPRQLAVSASAAIVIENPPLQTSPSANQRLYTQVQTWLWVDGSWWRTYTATATGRVSATATATPVLATWSMGDDATVECAGPGVAWQRGQPDSATDCAHTYRKSSANRQGGTYPLGVAVDFEVTWTSNTGLGGQLLGVARDASQQVEVGQIQAVESE